MKSKQPTKAKNFSNKLRQLRQDRRWSQGELGKKIGADLQRVSKYERGVVFPTTDIIVKIADAFQVSTDYLLRDEVELTADDIQNLDLRRSIKEINKLPTEDQNILVNLLDAYIKRKQFEDLIAK